MWLQHTGQGQRSKWQLKLCGDLLSLPINKFILVGGRHWKENLTFTCINHQPPIPDDGKWFL